MTSSKGGSRLYCVPCMGYAWLASGDEVELVRLLDQSKEWEQGLKLA